VRKDLSFTGPRRAKAGYPLALTFPLWSRGEELLGPSSLLHDTTIFGVEMKQFFDEE